MIMDNKKHKTMLSEHFSLEEMTYSRIAVDNALDNEPPPAIRQALGYLACHLLEPLRRLYNGPVAVLSGYRSEAVNRLAGGVTTSQHRKGEAADCYIPEGPLRLLELLKKSGLAFDQAIVYRKRRFLHLSLKETGINRMQVLFYLFCLLFLLPACRVRQQSMTEEQVFATDSFAVSDTRSSFLNHKIYTTDSTNWDITRLVLSPPDSVGRQYPAEITLLRANQLHHIADTVGETYHSSLKAIREQATLSSSSQKVYKQSFPVWICVAVLVVIAGITISFSLLTK